MAEAKSRISGKTALVTGAGKRLGRATALALAGEGASVVVHYHSSQAEADELAGEIRKIGPRSWVVNGNLADPEQADQVMGRAIGLAGPIDILVNNASIFQEDTIMDLTAQSLQRNVQINAMAPLQLMRSFAAQGRGGDIVNMLDARIADFDRKHMAYSLSKSLFFVITRIMAQKLAPAIRVNAVGPGLILPPEGKDESYLASLAHTTLLNTFGHERDITEAILFLLRSEFVTGQVLFVDGGRYLKGSMYAT